MALWGPFHLQKVSWLHFTYCLMLCYTFWMAGWKRMRMHPHPICNLAQKVELQFVDLNLARDWVLSSYRAEGDQQIAGVGSVLLNGYRKQSTCRISELVFECSAWFLKPALMLASTFNIHYTLHDVEPGVCYFIQLNGRKGQIMKEEIVSYHSLFLYFVSLSWENMKWTMAYKWWNLLFVLKMLKTHTEMIYSLAVFHTWLHVGRRKTFVRNVLNY